MTWLKAAGLIMIAAYSLTTQSPGLAQRRSPYQFFGDLRSMSCLSWTARPYPGPDLNREEWSRHAPEHAWVYGYLAGAGHMPSPVIGERITPIDVRLVDDWMDRYCGEHPTGTIEGALQVLIKEFAASR
jgi:hypothetical protein